MLEKRERRDTKTDVVVPIVRVVVIAISAPHVPIIVVERAATQHTAAVSRSRFCKSKRPKTHRLVSAMK